MGHVKIRFFKWWGNLRDPKTPREWNSIDIGVELSTLRKAPIEESLSHISSSFTLAHWKGPDDPMHSAWMSTLFFHVAFNGWRFVISWTALWDLLREHDFFSHVQSQGKVVWHDVNAVGKYTRYASGVGWKTFLNLWNEIGNDLTWNLKCELNHVLFCNHSLRSSGATSDVLQEFPCRPCPERQVQKPRNSTGWLQPANHSNRCPFAPVELATSRGNTPRNHEVWLQNNGISRGLRTLQLNSRVLPRHGMGSQDQGK